MTEPTNQLTLTAEATARCDDDVAIMEGIGQFGQTIIGPC
jgi:hypothetical protein